MYIQICNRFAHLTELYAILVLGSMVVHGPNFSIQFLCRPHRLSPRALSTVLRNALLFSSERRAEQPIRLWKIGILPLNCMRHSQIFFIWAGMSHNLKILGTPQLIGLYWLCTMNSWRTTVVHFQMGQVWWSFQWLLLPYIPYGPTGFVWKFMRFHPKSTGYSLFSFIFPHSPLWKDHSGLSSCSCQEGDCTAAGAFAHDTRGAPLKEMVPSRCKSTTKLTKA